MGKASGLGKGLSALISERKLDIESFAESKGRKLDLTLDEVFPSRFQPRVIFDPEEMDELAESIRRNGVVQPILVRKRAGQGYEIIAGERRWRASKLIKVKTVPAIIIDVDDRQAMEIALIENVQRQNLKILEEAEGYKKLIKEFKYTQEQLADVIGKSRSHVTNILRLLTLPQKVKKYLNEGKITTGHARALLSAPEPFEAANEVIKKKLSVRQTENYVKRITAGAGGIVVRKKYKRKKKSDFYEGESHEFQNSENISEEKHNISDPVELYKSLEEESLNKENEIKKEKEPEILMMEKAISESSGFSVEINDKDEAGQVVINYSSMEDLDKILSKLEK